MAHLLIFEIPGGDDFDIFNEALLLGHEITFITADLGFYKNSGALNKYELMLV